MYRWDVNVTDGGSWTNETFTFTTETEVVTWWNTGWLYRKNITIDHTTVDGGPITRFIAKLRERIRDGYGLDNVEIKKK